MTRPAKIEYDWESLQAEHLPGYDPYATASDGDYFDDEEAQRACDFFSEHLRLFEGIEGGGKPFILEGWQAAIVACLFGWKQKSGIRRYCEVFCYVPRKNGKTSLLSGIMLYVAYCDNEQGAQLYSAAAEREQAALIFNHATGMITRDKAMASRAKIYKTTRSIEFPKTGSVYKALSADAQTKQGFNTHFAAIDELHVHPNRELTDVLTTSTGTRKQPIVFFITTADFDRVSICNEKYDYACKVRDGIIEDRAMLPILYEATIDDDWADPAVWEKCNPNLGISVKEEWMARECKRAQDQPTFENTFKRLHLNIRTQQDVRWLSIDKWDECAGSYDIESLRGEVCTAGLDLANRHDIAACVLFFPKQNIVLPFFWLPEIVAADRDKRDHVPYLTWANNGLIELTRGDVIDYGFIRRRLNELKRLYDIQEVAYDPWDATQLAQQLQDEDGFRMVEFSQGFTKMNEPCREMERRVMAKELNHLGNDVLRWMASNVTVQISSSDLLRLDKKKSTEKIDGIAAMVMALGLAMRGDLELIYDKRMKDGSDEIITFV